MYLDCWTRIYGLISLEVFGHLCFALSDVEPMFDELLAERARSFGLTWRPEFGSG